MLLASCSYEEAVKYRNRLVVLSDEDDKKKPEEVWLNIVVEDRESLHEVLSKGIGVAKCVTTRDTVEGVVPDSLKDKVFRIYEYRSDYGDVIDDSDDFSLIDEEPVGVVPLIALPEGFCDMRFVYDVSKKYSRARFIGGNLLEIPGIGIGRFDKGKEKMSAVYNGVYDFFREVRLADIQVQEVFSKVNTSRTGVSRVKKESAPKPNTKSKKAEAFSKLFGGSGSEF